MGSLVRVLAVIVVVLIGLAACGGSSLEIVSPKEGAIITGAVVMKVQAYDVPRADDVGAFIDNEEVGATIMQNRCDDCTFELTLVADFVMNGEHALGVYYETDIAEGPSDSVTVVFARP